MSAMFTPASPRIVPTRPITPGRSSLRTKTMWGDGGTSTVWPSTMHQAGLGPQPDEGAGDGVAAAGRW